jgi:hypothetical protein
MMIVLVPALAWLVVVAGMFGPLFLHAVLQDRDDQRQR